MATRTVGGQFDHAISTWRLSQLCRLAPTANARKTPPRPASSPAPTPSIPSTTRRSRSSSPTTSSWATAPAPSWPSPPTTNATTSSPPSSNSPSSRSSPPEPPTTTEPGVATRGPSVPPISNQAFTDEGLAINSPWIDGLPTPEAKAKITAMLEAKGIGQKTINYKIRDWLFSRQRYWGEPFPLVHLEDGTTVPLADSELPLTLPELEDFKPTGTIDPPLSKRPGWFNVHVSGRSPLRRHYESTARVVPANTPGAVPATTRTQHHAPMGRQLLVLHPLPRPQEQHPIRRPRHRKILAGPRICPTRISQLRNLWQGWRGYPQPLRASVPPW